MPSNAAASSEHREIVRDGLMRYCRKSATRLFVALRTDFRERRRLEKSRTITRSYFLRTEQLSWANGSSSQSGQQDFIDQLRSRIRDVSDRLSHRPTHYSLGRKRAQQRFPSLNTGEPVRPIVVRENDWHAVVNGRINRVRSGGQNREWFKAGLTRRRPIRPPPFPQPREREIVRPGAQMW